MMLKTTPSIDIINLGGYSSTGRALDCDSKGWGFDPLYSPIQHLYKHAALTTTSNFLASPNTKREKLPIQLWWWYKRRTNIWRLLLRTYLRRVYKTSWDRGTTAIFTVCKPNKQFFINLQLRKFYSYSTGLVLQAINHPSRSFRRTRIGVKLLFNFILKQLPHNPKISQWLYILKTLNNYNMIKFHILKCIDQQAKPGILHVKLAKNYSKVNYKRLSYINKRIRRKYFVE